LFALRSIQNT